MMKTFSGFITESEQKDSYSLFVSDITKYINKVKRSLPVDVQKASYLTAQLELTSSDQIDTLRKTNKTDIPKLADKFGCASDRLMDLWMLLKSIKQNYKMLPQYMSKYEREEIEAGRLAVDDMTIDLSTPQGRNAAAKYYSPLAIAIVNKYVGVSKFGRSDLMAAAMEGLTRAMNEWKRSADDATKKTVSFKTYAGNCIKQEICNLMNTHGHTLSGTNWYAAKEYGAAMLDAVSLDNLGTSGDMDQDHLDALGVEDQPDKDDAKNWDKLYALLDRKFSQRDTDVFYRFFGVNGRKKEKSKDIAKSYGMSEGNIQNSIIKKMLKFIKTDKTAQGYLEQIQDIYSESLIVSLMGQKNVLECLIEDNIYMLLEELNVWRDKNKFQTTLKFALQASNDKEIKRVLGGTYEDIDSIIKTHKTPILKFLSHMYPSKNFSSMSDVSLIDYMSEIQQIYHDIN